MQNEPSQVLWASQTHGSLNTGYIRVHTFFNLETQNFRIEVEYSDFLGMQWQTLPQIA
jgi:hypothetical protein